VTQAAPTRILSDAAIARRAAGGNQRAFTEIFERYHQDLYRYCVAILGNSEDANDAVQNTMLKVLRALPGEKRELKLKPWLYRVAHNEAIDMIRARRGSEEIDAETLAARGGPVEEVEARGRLRQLISDIAELPDRQRGALVMREMSGLSYAQIGEALQTSPAVARQTIYEARLGLQQMSEGREMSCEEVMRAISDDDGRILRRRDIRAHLRSCEDCKAFRSEIAGRRREFSSLAPCPPRPRRESCRASWAARVVVGRARPAARPALPRGRRSAARSRSNRRQPSSPSRRLASSPPTTREHSTSASVATTALQPKARPPRPKRPASPPPRLVRSRLPGLLRPPLRGLTETGRT
jgi:RNA polymerase sigma factor (sigma-70 family)